MIDIIEIKRNQAVQYNFYIILTILETM